MLLSDFRAPKEKKVFTAPTQGDAALASFWS
jgi:hypothetical protein